MNKTTEITIEADVEFEFNKGTPAVTTGHPDTHTEGEEASIEVTSISIGNLKIGLSCFGPEEVETIENEILEQLKAEVE